jgi:hypothetical protein
MSKKLWLRGAIVSIIMTLLGITVNAQAAIIDLTTVNSSGSANGALFEWTNFDHAATGTGVFEPFLRIQATNTEQGYNTDAANPTFNAKKGIWTHSLELSDMFVVNKNGKNYYEFALDINQTSSNSYLSLDQIKIYMGNVPNYNSNILTTSAFPKVWDLDVGANGNSTILLNYALNPGSGKGDMLAYIPVFSLPQGYDSEQYKYVYFYSSFGAYNQSYNGISSWKSNDGFEEWSVDPPTRVVPEPATLSLFGLGLLGLVFKKKKIA